VRVWTGLGEGASHEITGVPVLGGRADSDGILESGEQLATIAGRRYSKTGRMRALRTVMVVAKKLLAASEVGQLEIAEVLHSLRWWRESG
jgi:hypothetical protein